MLTIKMLEGKKTRKKTKNKKQRQKLELIYFLQLKYLQIK